MTLNPSIARMLERYRDLKIPEIHKVREILQQSALFGLARQNFFEYAAFYGGTALRILYGLDRFSEDLDFSLISSNANFHLEPYLEGLSKEMEAFGFDVDISLKEKTQESAVLSAFLKSNTLTLSLLIHGQTKRQELHPEQKIKVRLEIDTDPPPGFHLEKKLVLNPTPFYVVTYALSDLFAGKMHAVLCRNWKNRVKGRDWYDFIWFVRLGVPLNLSHLEQRMRQTGHWGSREKLDENKMHQMLLERIDQIDWRQAKEDVAPFVTNPYLLDLWGPAFFKDLASHLKIE